MAFLCEDHLPRYCRGGHPGSFGPCEDCLPGAFPVVQCYSCRCQPPEVVAAASEAERRLERVRVALPQSGALTSPRLVRAPEGMWIYAQFQNILHAVTVRESLQSMPGLPATRWSVAFPMNFDLPVGVRISLK